MEKDERHLFIVHELCAGGELYDFLASLKTFDETRAADLFRLIAEAVQGIHDHGFLHRDIKPENILFVGAPAHVAKSRADFVDLGDKWVSPRIIDLGMADQYDPRAPTIGICGSPGFIAPEVLKGEQHSPKMDVYSLGVLLFMMLTGKVPYGEELSAECKYGSVPLGSAKHWIDGTTDPLSHNARSLLARMLEPRPTRRISLKEVLAHQWLQPGGQGDAVLR